MLDASQQLAMLTFKDHKGKYIKKKKEKRKKIKRPPVSNLSAKYQWKFFGKSPTIVKWAHSVYRVQSHINLPSLTYRPTCNQNSIDEHSDSNLQEIACLLLRDFMMQSYLLNHKERAQWYSGAVEGAHYCNLMVVSSSHVTN